MSHPVEHFPNTHWSLILAAQGEETPGARQAMERLFATYWYPVYAFIRSRVPQAADAEDLTQGFFASLLEHCSLDTVRPELGRFRAFLLASAKNYLATERARNRARKHGGGTTAIPLDFASADMRYQLEAASVENPELQFERQWARAAFDAAIEKLRQEYAAAGKAVPFEAFRQYLTAADEPASYAEVAAGLEMTEAAVRVAVHRARRRFGRILRQEIAQTVAGEEAEPNAWECAVEDEVSYLFRVLGS